MFTIIVVSLQEEGTNFFTLVLGSPQQLNERRQVFQTFSIILGVVEIPIGNEGTRTLKNLRLKTQLSSSSPPDLPRNIFLVQLATPS
jgi:hypothetical protein